VALAVLRRIVDYSDQLGARHIKTFRRKRDADQHHATVAIDVRAGIHTADRASITLATDRTAKSFDSVSRGRCPSISRRGHILAMNYKSAAVSLT
jgi:integrase